MILGWMVFSSAFFCYNGNTAKGEHHETTEEEKKKKKKQRDLGSFFSG